MPELLVTSRRAHAASDRFATEREMEALIYLAASRVPVSAEALGRDLEFDGEPADRPERRHRGALIVRRLGFAGLLGFKGDSYFLSERGRIAAALVMFKHPGLRGAFFDE